MEAKVQKVLNKIEEHGYEAYVVGGYVRDHLLGIETTDIDICTNALPKDVMAIFELPTNHTYGSVSFTLGKYNFDITTYRSEAGYDKRKPTEVEYVNSLITDLKRRDFTINALCMNSSGVIIDLLNGREALDNRIICSIGDVEKKFTEDPLRILRAIRFSITLDFELSQDILKFINERKELIKTLSYYRKQEEINRIISCKNAELGLRTLQELGLLELLEISYDANLVIVPDILGIWAQMTYSDAYPFTKSSTETIKAIRKILARGIIDNLTLFNYSLYISTVAGEILGIDRATITSMNANLPLKSAKDLAINSKDIFEILELEPSPKVKVIYNDVLERILTQELENDYEKIKEYLINKWK